MIKGMRKLWVSHKLTQMWMAPVMVAVPLWDAAYLKMFYTAPTDSERLRLTHAWIKFTKRVVEGKEEERKVFKEMEKYFSKR